MNNKRWNLVPPGENTPAGGYTNAESLVTALLASRGYLTAEDQHAFLNPALASIIDPFLLKNMDQAVSRIVKALQNKEPVCVYGDYDVDGITSTALLVSFLRHIGCNCSYFIPNRFDDGYGLSSDALQKCISSGAKIIISVDCGTTSVAEARFCSELGVDLIVVDHHAPKDQLPDCCALLNPLQPGCRYPFKSLAGAGVTFSLAIALRSALRDKGLFAGSTEPDLREWLDLVALGTIADVMPLVGQNRIYAHHGLLQLSQTTRSGLSALKKVAGVSGSVSCGQVGFRLAPRLNAAGRMESAVPGVDLLLSTSQEQSLIIANELDAANTERQAIERQIFQQAVEMVEESGIYPGCRSIVLASDQWHQGVIGIVASRLVERYYRPTILIAVDETGMGKGSGRSISGFHLLESLQLVGRFLERFGGHRYAAGIGIAAENIAAFAAAFETEAQKRLSADDCIPSLLIDAEVQPEQVTIALAQKLALMAPFGAGNPEPLLLLRTVTVLDQRVMAGKHLRLHVSKNGVTFSAIGFGMGDRTIPECIDMVFFPEINHWNGKRSMQLRIKDLRPGER